MIKRDGGIEQLLDVSNVSNGVKGYNSVSINIAYIGGIAKDKNNKIYDIDNRTEEQKKALVQLLKKLKKDYPEAKIRGHRDFDKNKSCPVFDATQEYANL